MNPYVKQLLITTGIYGTLVAMIFLLSWTSPAGGVPILLLGVPIVSSILFCKSIYRMLNKNFEFLIPFFASISSLAYLAFQLNEGPSY